MKKKLTISILLASIITIFFALNLQIVQAATGSFSVPSSVSVKKGKSTTFTVSLKNCEGKFSVSSSNSSIAAISYSADWKESSFSVKVTGKKAGTAKVTVTASDVSDTSAKEVTGSKTVTVKVTDSTNNNNNNSNNNNNNSNNSNNSNTASNDATLKNLGITPNDFSGFRKATTSYSVTVPNNVAKISIYAYASDSKATVTGTGSKSLNVGKNTFAIKVTAQDKKTTKTYTLTITRKDKEDNTTDDNTEDDSKLSTDATLRNFGITPTKYDFSGFKKGKTTYSVVVPKSAETISIYAYASDSKATVTGTGEKSLKIGKNSFEVKVTAEDKKTTKTYSLTVIRKAEDEPEEEPDEKELEEEPTNTSEDNTTNISSSGIKDILISGYTLKPEFSATTHEYSVNIPEKLEKLDIKVKTSGSNIETEIAGNNNLKVGTNIITVIAHNKKEDVTETYQIYAVVGEEKIDVTTYNSEVENVQAGVRKKEMLVKVAIVIIVILLATFVITRYIITKRLNLEEDNRYYNEGTTDEIENPYSINKTEDFEEERVKRTRRKRAKGKRFK